VWVRSRSTKDHNAKGTHAKTDNQSKCQQDHLLEPPQHPSAASLAVCGGGSWAATQSPKRTKARTAGFGHPLSTTIKANFFVKFSNHNVVC